MNNFNSNLVEEFDDFNRQIDQLSRGNLPETPETWDPDGMPLDILTEEEEVANWHPVNEPASALPLSGNNCDLHAEDVDRQTEENPGLAEYPVIGFAPPHSQNNWVNAVNDDVTAFGGKRRREKRSNYTDEEWVARKKGQARNNTRNYNRSKEDLEFDLQVELLVMKPILKNVRKEVDSLNASIKEYLEKNGRLKLVEPECLEFRDLILENAKEDVNKLEETGKKIEENIRAENGLLSTLASQRCRNPKKVKLAEVYRDVAQTHYDIRLLQAKKEILLKTDVWKIVPWSLLSPDHLPQIASLLPPPKGEDELQNYRSWLEEQQRGSLPSSLAQLSVYSPLQQ